MKAGSDPFDVAVGQEIARLRSGAQRTRNDLARALGISYQQIQKYETGKSALTFSKMMQIAEFLDVSFLELLPEAERLAADPKSQENAEQISRLPIEKPDIALPQAIAETDDAIVKEALIALVARMSPSKAAG